MYQHAFNICSISVFNCWSLIHSSTDCILFEINSSEEQNNTSIDKIRLIGSQWSGRVDWWISGNATYSLFCTQLTQLQILVAILGISAANSR